MGSGHCARGGNPNQRLIEAQEMEVVCARRRKMAAVVKSGLEFCISPLFIAVVANGALIVHNASLGINSPHRLGGGKGWFTV
jgi:hypothetical protein